MNVSLRKATPSDEDLIFHWRNLPEIYNLGKEKRPVEPDEHHLWFQSVIKDKKHIFLIVTFKGVDCGIVRYSNIKDQEWEISLYIVENRQNGIGSTALTLSYTFLPKGSKIIANILNNNTQGIIFFNRNEFRKENKGNSKLLKMVRTI